MVYRGYGESRTWARSLVVRFDPFIDLQPPRLKEAFVVFKGPALL